MQAKETKSKSGKTLACPQKQFSLNVKLGMKIDSTPVWEQIGPKKSQKERGFSGNMRVFVIGGTGFLGTHLVPRLQKQGHEVTILTRSREKASKLENLGIKVVVGDLLSPTKLYPC